MNLSWAIVIFLGFLNIQESLAKSIRDPKCELYVVTEGSQFPASIIRAYPFAIQTVVSEVSPILNRKGYTIRTITNDSLDKIGLESAYHRYLLLRISQEQEITMNVDSGEVSKIENGLIKRISIGRVVEQKKMHMREKHWDAAFFADVCHQDPSYYGENGDLRTCRAPNSFAAMAQELPDCMKVSLR